MMAGARCNGFRVTLWAASSGGQLSGAFGAARGVACVQDAQQAVAIGSNPWCPCSQRRLLAHDTPCGPWADAISALRSRSPRALA